jgi:ElaB/YqjD/DUF883 family membrane-anchored ribosome-binding protein
MAHQQSGHGPEHAQQTAKDCLRDMTDAATDKVKDVAENAQQIAGRVTDQARQYGEQAQETLKQASTFVEKSLKEQPIAILVGIAALGFVLGALWKMQKS